MGTLVQAERETSKRFESSNDHGHGYLSLCIQLSFLFWCPALAFFWGATPHSRPGYTMLWALGITPGFGLANQNWTSSLGLHGSIQKGGQF